MISVFLALIARISIGCNMKFILWTTEFRNDWNGRLAADCKFTTLCTTQCVVYTGILCESLKRFASKPYLPRFRPMPTHMLFAHQNSARLVDGAAVENNVWNRVCLKALNSLANGTIRNSIREAGMLRSKPRSDMQNAARIDSHR